MPFTMPDFGRISFAEANPLLTGIESGQKLMQNFMKFPQEMQKAIIDNQLNQQKMEWNPQIWQSEIGLRDAQAPYYQAQTQKLNTMTPIEARAKNIDVEKAVRELEIDREFQRILQQSMQRTNNQQTAPSNMQAQNANIQQPFNIANQPQFPLQNRQPMQLPGLQNLGVQMPPLQEGITQNQLLPPEVEMPEASTLAGTPGQQVFSQGNPNLYKFDELYENYPQYREKLNKLKLTKEQKIRLDKSGAASLVTKYPSGKVTIQSTGGLQAKDIMDNNIPLTKPVLNLMVNQVRGTDAVLPYIDKLLEMGDIQFDKNGKPIGAGKNNKLPFSDWIPTNARANYRATVSSALEKYITASGLRQSDISTKKMEQVLERGNNEDSDNYMRRLYNQKQEIIRDRKMTAEMIKKGLKIHGGNIEMERERTGASEGDGLGLQNFDPGA